MPATGASAVSVDRRFSLPDGVRHAVWVVIAISFGTCCYRMGMADGQFQVAAGLAACDRNVRIHSVEWDCYFIRDREDAQ